MNSIESDYTYGDTDSLAACSKCGKSKITFSKCDCAPMCKICIDEVATQSTLNYLFCGSNVTCARCGQRMNAKITRRVSCGDTGYDALTLLFSLIAATCIIGGIYVPEWKPEYVTGPIIAGVALFIYLLVTCVWASSLSYQTESRSYAIYSAATAGAVIISQAVGVGICYWWVKVVMHPNIVTFGMGVGAIAAVIIGIIVVLVAVCIIVLIIGAVGKGIWLAADALISGKCIKINKTVTID